MSTQDFNELVDLAMQNSALALMRPVVEKELLHYEIFAALDGAKQLKHLVFQGGTSLRLCRGSDRFSEDLDFVGGKNFNSAQMENIETCIKAHIGKRFGLSVTVRPPKFADRSTSLVTVDKWWITIETARGNPAMPSQKIKLEIANIPAYTLESVPLMQNYEILGGMKSILVNVETSSEVLADKIVAFPTSLLDNAGLPLPATGSKIRHRDIWDIAWLIQKRAVLDPAMVQKKLLDYGIKNYPEMLASAISLLPDIVRSRQFKDQMRRFIAADTFQKTLATAPYLDYLISTVSGQFGDMTNYLKNPKVLLK